MISWLSRHRPRRRGGKKSPKSPSSIPAADADLALVKISTGVSERPAAFRARRQDTDATLVDGSDVYSDSDSSSLFDSDSKIPLTRCASPDSFDSLPLPKEPASHRAVKTNVNLDDPSLWKKSLQDSNHGPQCFGPVPLDCQPSVKAHRSKWSKLASGTTHSISTVLQASIILGEASNIPYLKGLAGILLLISNSVQATEDNRVDCIRLSKMVIELASVAARYLEENGPTPQFSLSMETLTRTFTRILQALQTNLKRSYARRYVEASNERDLLRDCEKELQHCLDTFQIRSHIAISVAINRKSTGDEAFEGQVSNVLHPVKSLLAQTVTEIETTSEALEISDEPEDLPPLPQISYGRENELSDLVCMFSQPLQAHAVLLGQAGSGKSSLALELLHQPEIKHKFRHQRLFVKCKSARTTWDLLSRLGSAMGLPHCAGESEPSAYKDTVLNSLGSSSVPCLIVFDDLDDAWDPPSTKLDVEDFLTELSNIPTLSLLLTLRGTQRPMGPAYSKPAPAPLGSLSPSAARETFFAISDVAEDGEDAPLVDVLLQLVGYLPLAITALGQLAQYEPLPFLLERYREEGTAMLCDGEVSMDESIEATLYSARISECPAALEVLSVLARFPQGTPKTEVSALVTNGGRLPGAIVNKCMSVLHCTSLLVVVSGDGRPQCETVKVPEVIRTYLERHVLDGSRYRRIEEL